jgi:hypothetical protein
MPTACGNIRFSGKTGSVARRILRPGSTRSRGRADALYACADALVSANAARINALALAARLLTMFYAREYVQDGGFMSYGPNVPELFRRSAEFVDEILRGPNRPIFRSNSRPRSS